MDNRMFQLNAKTRNYLLVMIAIGLLALAYGLFGDPGAKRVAAGLLLNNIYFIHIGLIGLFFVTVHAIAESGWQTSIQRVGEAMSAFIPVGSVLLLLLFVLGGMPLLFEWTHTEHLDALLLKKVAYLNVPFFYVRFFIISGAWVILWHFIRKTSLQMDTGDLKYFHRMRTLSAIFVVFLALSTVVASWDWLMSIDAHWFSTLYGWYVFSSMLASGIALYIILLFLLKRMGYMQHVNVEHIHDMGKYLFGFSIFWAYLWFSQYLLIWYANIPEETVYFYVRQKYFPSLFYINLILNFLIPFLALMTRNSKRSFAVLVPVSVIVFIGHWVDLYLMITPGVVGGENASIGLFEIGLTIGYLGLFFLVTFFSLSKAPLKPEKHPFYKESLDYHTNY
jgi:hypothetical protein